MGCRCAPVRWALWNGGFHPRRRSPPGTPPGVYGTNVEGLSDMPTGIVFRERVPENRERSANYPVNARSIFSFSKRLGSGWALGGHPETSAQPGADWTRFHSANHFGQGMG